MALACGCGAGCHSWRPGDATTQLAPFVEPQPATPAEGADPEATPAADDSVPSGAAQPANASKGQISPKGADSAAAAPPAEALANVAEPSATGVDERLKSDAWHLAAGADAEPLPQQQSTPQVDRWRHEGVAEMVALPAGERPDLTEALASDEPVVAGNAAIVLARMGALNDPSPLVAVVRTASLKLGQRRAAVEALPRVNGPGVAAALAQLIDQYGEGGASSTPEMHAELLAALARCTDAADEQRFVAALSASSAEVRRAAMRAWCYPGRAEVPREVLDHLTDPDPQVRRLALAALVLREHGEAEGFLKTALNDEQLEVRKGAIAALGRRRSEAAAGLLRGLLDHRAELIRAAAVSALAEHGDESSLVDALADTAWQVRAAAAEGLGRFPGRRTAGRLAALLEDASLDVRRRAVAAVQDWPVAEALPVLWAGMASSSYAVRREASEQLSAAWPAARVFVADAPADRRAEWLNQLREAWSHQALSREALPTEAPFREAQSPEVGSIAREPTPGETQQSEGATVAPAASANAQQIEKWLRAIEQAESPETTRAALDALGQAGAGAVSVLGHLVTDQGRVLPESVYLTALPQVSEQFARLSELTSDDVTLRRQAAEQLADAAEETPLAPLARERLVQLAQRESDPLVWREALTALAEDGSEAATRLAIAGLSHPDSEVRRRACVRLGRFPQAEQARLLVPALDDSHTGVVRAAVAAIAAGGTLPDPQGLEKLLGHPDRTLRVEAATALCRIGNEAGGAALERLAHDHDNDVRRRAAKAMGELNEKQFLPTLITLLEDPLSTVRQSAEDALLRVAGADVGRRADPAAGPQQRAEQWKRWWREQSTADVVSRPGAP